MEDVAATSWWGRWWPALGLMAAIFAVSSLPAARLPVPEVLLSFDKLLHAAAYALLAALAARAVAPAGPARAIALGIGLAVLYGFSDELHQLWTPGREASALDWVADAAGSVAGAPFGWYIARPRREREP